jgi:predicted aspartyl protease
VESNGKATRQVAPPLEDSMKKSSDFSIRIAWCGLLVFIVLLAGNPTFARSIIKFEYRSSDLIIVPVFLNGQGPYDFMLDTGASTTLVQLELGRELGMHAMDRILLTSPIRSQVGLRSSLRKVTLGTQSVEDLDVLLTDLREIRLLHSRIRGVLGQNFLSQFNYLLNNRTRQIVFEDGHELEEQLLGTHLWIELNNGRSLIRITSLFSGKGILQFILDSGASTPLVFEKAAWKRGLNITREENLRAQIATFAGRALARRGTIDSLHIGTHTLLNLPVIMISPRTANDERTEDGLLPTRLFNSIYFNNRERFVILNPRSSNQR